MSRAYNSGHFPNVLILKEPKCNPIECWNDLTDFVGTTLKVNKNGYFFCAHATIHMHKTKYDNI